MSVFEILDFLKRKSVSFELSNHRDGLVMISAAVPGERWEIEVSQSGDVEVEIFRSDGEIYGFDKLSDIE